MRSSRLRGAVGLLAAVASVFLAQVTETRAEPDPAATLRSIQTVRLDPTAAVAIHGLRIDLGLGALEVDNGVLVPAEPIEGSIYELVFEGSATFALEPPDEIEEEQLELFTGQSSLVTEIDQAVLTIGSPAIVAKLIEGREQAQLDPARVEAVEALFEDWVDGPVRRGFEADMAQFGAAMGDPALERFVSAWLKSERLGDFHYVVDPTEFEPVSLGQFVAADLGDFDRKAIERYISKQRRRKGGQFEHITADDLGTWDDWISTALAPWQDVDPVVRHYEIEATLSAKPPRIEASARFDLTCPSIARRVFALGLHPDLEISAVRDGEGNELFHTRSGYQVYVVLQSEVGAGEEFSLRIDYAGAVLTKLESGVIVLEDTAGWYPQPAGPGRSTFDVTLRWPKHLSLLAGGVPVDSGEDGALSWERRELDAPALAFSFEVGDFKVHRQQVGHVELEVAFSTISGLKDRHAMEETVATLTDALEFFEETFGPYPLDRLTVVTVPRGFSQGYLSFITLSHHLLWTPTGYISLLDDEQRARYRAETIAHELSHQWWGNIVGWASYRDQWLSEALANYSAVLFMRNREKSESIYLARHAKEWRNSLLKRTRDGRTYESLGPVVLGQRLASSKAEGAYDAIVYDKGSVVFHMLADGIGEETFTRMLAAVADAADYRRIDTRTFVKAMEHLSGLDLGGFADRFIYGTGMPEIYYRYVFHPDEEQRWRIEGEATQVAEGRYTYRLEHLAGGGWDITRNRAADMEVDDSWLVVPFQITLESVHTEVARKKRGELKSGRGLAGRLLLQGATTPFEVKIDERPRDFFLDQNGEVLATFFCESRQPKRGLRYRGELLLGEGQLDEAEELFRRALESPVYSESVREYHDRQEISRSASYQDALIWFDLSRLYLDRDQDDLAREAFQEGRKALGGPRRESFKTRQVLLESRMDLRQGNAKGAWSKLAEHVRLTFNRDFDESFRDTARRNRFRTGRVVSGGGYALLAAAAYEVGKLEVARRALEEAEERGADMESLKPLLEGQSGG